MTTPVHTAQACRDQIRIHLAEIRRVVESPEPTLAEIEEIVANANMIASISRRWRTAEGLIIAAPRTNRLCPLFESLVQPMRGGAA